jgi:nucleoid-associated protein YgaU
VEKAQSETSAKAAALATAEQARAEVETRLGTESARVAATEKAAAEKLAAAQREAKTVGDKLAANERAASEAQERLGRLEHLLAEEKKAHVAMAAEIETLKSGVPATRGGTLTPDLARAAAAKAGESFLTAEQRARKERSDEAKAALKEATAALREAQFDVAVATDAQGVYRLRAEDTLGMVAGRFFGTGNRWPLIFEANRHVLASPDALVPGITLVVP